MEDKTPAKGSKRNADIKCQKVLGRLDHSSQFTVYGGPSMVHQLAYRLNLITGCEDLFYSWQPTESLAACRS